MALKHPDLQPLPEDYSMSVGRIYVEVNAQKEGPGVACPCCGQRCKVYTRRINSALARFLIWLVRSYEENPRWIHIREFPMIQNRRGGGDFAKLVHFGLLEQQSNEDDRTKRTSGYWKPLQKANDFVYRRIDLPVYVRLYDNIPQGFSDTRITIEQCLGQQFNYEELMSR